MPDIPSSLTDRGNWPSIFHLMTVVPYRGALESEQANENPDAEYWKGCVKGSFSYLMARISGDPPPDAFGFTAFSAVPVAEAVKKYYATLGVRCPKLLTIPRQSSCNPRSTHSPEQAVLFSREEELYRRMPQYLDGLSSIVIIDQAVGSGRTVDEAVETCKKFGVHDVVKVPRETKWYDQGYEFTNPATHPDEINMTSPYSEIMGEIGETAAKVVDTLGQELLAATA